MHIMLCFFYSFPEKETREGGNGKPWSGLTLWLTFLSCHKARGRNLQLTLVATLMLAGSYNSDFLVWKLAARIHIHYVLFL